MLHFTLVADYGAIRPHFAVDGIRGRAPYRDESETAPRSHDDALNRNRGGKTPGRLRRCALDLTT
jgi:hypothetical protein